MSGATRGGRNDHDGLRHAGSERPQSITWSGRGGTRVKLPEFGDQGCLPEAADAGQAHRAQAVYLQARRGPAGDSELGGGPQNPKTPKPQNPFDYPYELLKLDI